MIKHTPEKNRYLWKHDDIEFLGEVQEGEDASSSEDPNWQESIPTSNVCDAIKEEIAKYTEDQLEGLRVYVNDELGEAVIDRLDWYDKSDDVDPAANIGLVAERVYGKENVTYQNEGDSRKGGGWLCLNSVSHQPELEEFL